MIDERHVRRLEAQIDAMRTRVKGEDERKTYDEVFDKPTLLLIAKLISDRVIVTVDYPVSTGKEGNVFHATAPGGAVALKIYRVNTATFRNMANYVLGDSRFRNVRKVQRDIIYAWAQKEYKNLLGMHAAGARVPRAIGQRNNVLVMTYLGDETRPAPLLREVALDDPAAALEDLLDSMRAIRRAGLVHSDLSEYNVLVWDGHLWVIDCGQAVPLNHGHAEEWFLRDCRNIARYFRRLGVDTAPESIANAVRRG